MFDRRGGGQEEKKDEISLAQLIMLLESIDGERLYEEEREVGGNVVRQRKNYSSHPRIFMFFNSFFKMFSPLDQNLEEREQAEDAPLLSEPHGEHRAHLPEPNREEEIEQIINSVSERLQAAMEQEIAIFKRELLQRRRR